MKVIAPANFIFLFTKSSWNTLPELLNNESLLALRVAFNDEPFTAASTSSVDTTDPIIKLTTATVPE